MWAAINFIALRMAKTLWSFGSSACNRVKAYEYISMAFCHFLSKETTSLDFLFCSLDNLVFLKWDLFLKNLLQEEKFIFYKSWTLLRRILLQEEKIIFYKSWTLLRRILLQEEKFIELNPTEKDSAPRRKIYRVEPYWEGFCSKKKNL